MASCADTDLELMVIPEADVWFPRNMDGSDPDEACYYIGSANTYGDAARDLIEKHLGLCQLRAVKQERRGMSWYSHVSNFPHFEWDGVGEPPVGAPSEEEVIYHANIQYATDITGPLHGCRIIYGGLPTEALTMSYYCRYTTTNMYKEIDICGNVILPEATVVLENNGDGTWAYRVEGLNTIGTYTYWVTGSCDVNNCLDNYSCAYGMCTPDEGWEYCLEGYDELCPETPGIPSGPTLKPPTVLDPDRTDPENPTCPDCYEYDSVQDVCIYVGGEGCEEEVPCVKTASCDDDLLITGNCINRDEC